MHSFDDRSNDLPIMRVRTAVNSWPRIRSKTGMETSGQGRMRVAVYSMAGTLDFHFGVRLILMV